MLSGFESFLAAQVAERLAARPGLSVSVPGAPAAPTAGTGVLQLGVSTTIPDVVRGFSPGDVLPPVNDPAAIHAVPLRATVTATLTRRATAPSDAGIRAARTAVLEDFTVLLHSLDEPKVHNGKALTSSAPDPGFRVLDFAFTAATVPAVIGDLVTVAATFDCGLYVWPPGTTAEGGLIDAVDALVEAQPLTVAAAPPIVVTGATATIRIEGVVGSRLVDVATGTREPLAIAVGVSSELPPADRGSIDGGAATLLTGFRAFPVTEPATTITYVAPSGGLGVVRTEEVLVHLAVPSDSAAPGVGVRLGTVTVALREGP